MVTSHVCTSPLVLWEGESETLEIYSVWPSCTLALSSVMSGLGNQDFTRLGSYPQCHVAAIQLSVTESVSWFIDYRERQESMELHVHDTNTWYPMWRDTRPGLQVGGMALPGPARRRKISSGDQITICNVVTYTNINISCLSLSNQPGPRQGPTGQDTANQDTVLLYFHQLRPSWSGQDYTQHLEILKTKLLVTLTGPQTGARGLYRGGECQYDLHVPEFIKNLGHQLRVGSYYILIHSSIPAVGPGLPYSVLVVGWKSRERNSACAKISDESCVRTFCVPVCGGLPGWPGMDGRDWRYSVSRGLVNIQTQSPQASNGENWLKRKSLIFNYNNDLW